MPVPSSGPISFSVIASNLSPAIPTPYSLNYMAQSAGFSSPHSVEEFYGYDPGGGGGGVPWTISDTGIPDDPNTMCAIGPGFSPQELFWAGPGIPSYSNQVFTDSALTTPFDGGRLWWYSYSDNLTYLISENGEIFDIQPCK
jgi:hypothetical protein